MPPLEGVRVVDQTQVMAGPFCTMLLADMGADVLKVESPEGDSTRRQLVKGPASAFFAVNRNKRALSLDLKRPEGLAVFRRLVATADVAVENYRPGVAARLGVDYERLRVVNPRLVYCSISGFGQTGPYASRGGFDLVAQGMSGLMSLTGEEGGAPVKVGVPVTDLGAGLLAVFGILAALRARRVTGRGQFVDTSLFEAGLALGALSAVEYWATGEAPRGTGSADRRSAPAQAFRASDGWLAVEAGDEPRWRRFAELLGLGQLADDARFRVASARLTNRQALARLVEAVTATKPREHWLGLLERAGIPAAPVLTVPEALADPHVQARGMVASVEHPDAGRVPTLGNPVKIDGAPLAPRKGAPRLGEDRDAVLGSLGYGEAEVADLVRTGVVS